MQVITTDALYQAALPGGWTVTCMSYALDGALLLLGTDKGVLMAFAATGTTQTSSSSSSSSSTRVATAVASATPPSTRKNRRQQQQQQQQQHRASCGELIFAETLHYGAVLDVQLNSTSDRLITAGHDATCAVFSLTEIFSSPRLESNSIAVRHSKRAKRDDGSASLFIAPASANGVNKTLTCSRLDCARRIVTGHSLPIVSATFFTYANSVAALAVDGRLEIIDLAGCDGGSDVLVRRVVFAGGGFAARTLCLSADETFGFIGGECLVRVDLQHGRRADASASSSASASLYSDDWALAEDGSRNVSCDDDVRQNFSRYDRSEDARGSIGNYANEAAACSPNHHANRRSVLTAENGLSVHVNRGSTSATFYEWVECVEGSDAGHPARPDERDVYPIRRRRRTDENVFIDHLHIDRCASTLIASFVQYTPAGDNVRRLWPYASAMWSMDSCEYWCSRMYRAHASGASFPTSAAPPATLSKTLSPSWVTTWDACSCPERNDRALNAICWPTLAKNTSMDLLACIRAAQKRNNAARRSGRSHASYSARRDDAALEMLPGRFADSSWPAELATPLPWNNTRMCSLCSACVPSSSTVSHRCSVSGTDRDTDCGTGHTRLTRAEQMAIAVEEKRRLERECSVLVGQVKQLLSARSIE